MQIVFTIHAQERMAIRGITRSMVEETIRNPDNRGVGYQDRLLAYKTFPGGTIKVVYVIENAKFVVISVMWA